LIIFALCYGYEFGEGGKVFYALTGELITSPDIQIGDWMYVVLEGKSVDAFSPKNN